MIDTRAGQSQLPMKLEVQITPESNLGKEVET